MCLSQVSERFLRISLCTEGAGEGTPITEFGLDQVNFNMCRLEKDTRNESSLRKFMNVNDVQVPDEDDRERANLRGKQSLATEQIWINPVTSKSMAQLLDTDTDAQLHEESAISMRKQAGICISSST